MRNRNKMEEACEQYADDRMPRRDFLRRMTSLRISTRGQWLRSLRISRRRCAAISRPLGRLAGRSTAVTKRPAPSNTMIG